MQWKGVIQMWTVLLNSKGKLKCYGSNSFVGFRYSCQRSGHWFYLQRETFSPDLHWFFSLDDLWHTPFDSGSFHLLFLPPCWLQVTVKNVKCMLKMEYNRNDFNILSNLNVLPKVACLTSLFTCSEFAVLLNNPNVWEELYPLTGSM